MIIIHPHTPMLLFRYKSYKHYDFIASHHSVLEQNGSVWMMKAGKKTSTEKIKSIEKSGGWMILRSPKSEGGNTFLARFSKYSDSIPADGHFPRYYQEILNEEDDEVLNMYTDYQWFCLTMILPLPKESISGIVLSKTQMPINDIIGTTRTAVMFVENKIQINVKDI